jgi:glyoxylase-like metal-dependent hydrolase (beta-lactamase superfamily II)
VTAQTSVPILFDAAPGITGVDTGLAGQRQLNSVFVIAALEPALVETGPGADEPVVVAALERLGLDSSDLAHVIVTHIHLDHAGGAGALLQRYPHATIWVHERGAPHLADPARLIASTARTYGEARMQSFFGDTLPIDAARIRSVADGDRIALGDRDLQVLHTPGHASNHIALRESGSAAVFTGEAIGSYLPWADAYRPALPPPEVDVEAALASIRRIEASDASVLLTSHFGVVEDPLDACARAAERIRAWAETVRGALSADPLARADDIAGQLTVQAEREFLADAGTPIELARYDALGSIHMNAEGLSRYWRKRWEREEQGSNSG